MLLEKYRPRKWYFGHWHQFRKFDNQGTDFTLLSGSFDCYLPKAERLVEVINI